MTRFAIALGSNEGARVEHLRVAANEIGALGDRWRISGLYETSPVGGPEQDPYLNAVMSLESSRSPNAMMNELQAIEARHGRERTVRWGPRTLDLDIVAIEPGTVDTPELQIPHPRAAERRFVLEPLCDVWPDAMVGEGLTAAEARELVAGQEVDLLTTTWLEDDAKAGRYWVGAQLLIFLGVLVALAIDGSVPSGIDGWRIAGGLLMVVGALLVVVAGRALGSALTPMPEPVKGAELVRTGPYAWARHPIYGGVCLVALGASLLFSSNAAFIVGIGLVAFFWVKSSYEERLLRMAHPGYSAYRKRVRPRLFPFMI